MRRFLVSYLLLVSLLIFFPIEVGADGVLHISYVRWGTVDQIGGGRAGTTSAFTVFLKNNWTFSVELIYANLSIPSPLTSPSGRGFEVVYPGIQEKTATIPPKSVYPLTFAVKIPSTASGEYTFNLTVKYRKAVEETQKLSFTLRVVPQDKIHIQELTWMPLEDGTAPELYFSIINLGKEEVKLGSVIVSADFVQVLNPSSSLSLYLEPGQRYRFPVRVKVPKGASQYNFTIITISVTYESEGSIKHHTESFTYKLLRSGSELGPEIILQVNRTELRPGVMNLVMLKVSNVGDERAERVTITMQSSSGILVLGSSSVYVGDLPPGASRSLLVKVLPSSQHSSYALLATITYKRLYEGSYVSESRGLTLGFNGMKEAKISVTNIEASFNGDRLKITGTLANMGDRVAKNVNVVAINGPCANISNYVGDVNEGDTAGFFLSCRVSGSSKMPDKVTVEISYEAAPGYIKHLSKEVSVAKPISTVEKETTSQGYGMTSLVVVAIAGIIVGLVTGRFLFKRS